ncbi:hypothetical protein NC652_022297 [Populus alba x Populus x berolinensis]|nr:hypothetical protein NC652_022297 [Populus alba x Populus x berolinensis]
MICQYWSHRSNVISVLIGTFWKNTKSTDRRRTLRAFPTSARCLELILVDLLWNHKARAYLVATVNGFGIVSGNHLCIFIPCLRPSKEEGSSLIQTRIKDASYLIRLPFLLGSLDVGFWRQPILATTAGSPWRSTDRCHRVSYVCWPQHYYKTVVTTKSVEYMPFFLSFFFFLNGGIWTFYAILTRDYFLGVPNGAGFLLGIAQLVLYAIYKNAKPSINVSNRLEEGCEQESLISSSNYSN